MPANERSKREPGQLIIAGGVVIAFSAVPFVWGALASSLQSAQIGNQLGVSGLALALGGFALTIWQVSKTASAQEQIANTVESINRDTERVDSVALCSEIAKMMEEIKLLHRREVWELLPDRYSAVRDKLVSLRLNGESLSSDDQKFLQSAILAYSTMEQSLDSRGAAKPEVAKLNQTIIKQTIRLHEIKQFFVKQRGEQ